jgi:hypothetical protein
MGAVQLCFQSLQGVYKALSLQITKKTEEIGSFEKTGERD